MRQFIIGAIVIGGLLICAGPVWAGDEAVIQPYCELIGVETLSFDEPVVGDMDDGQTWGDNQVNIKIESAIEDEQVIRAASVAVPEPYAIIVFMLGGVVLFRRPKQRIVRE